MARKTRRTDRAHGAKRWCGARGKHGFVLLRLDRPTPADRRRGAGGYLGRKFGAASSAEDKRRDVARRVLGACARRSGIADRAAWIETMSALVALLNRLSAH